MINKRELVEIEFTEQKFDSENDENIIDFKLSDISGEDDEGIPKDNSIESLQKQVDEEIFTKRVT